MEPQLQESASFTTEHALLAASVAEYIVQAQQLCKLRRDNPGLERILSEHLHIPMPVVPARVEFTVEMAPESSAEMKILGPS